MTDWRLNVSPRKGYVYRTADAEIVVARVARDLAWADIHVEQFGSHARWSKRQPLSAGLFPFDAFIWSTEVSR